MFAGENERTPYLASRFYRAPEVILGMAYGHPMDMWAMGATLYELYTGKILFPGGSNNAMLRLMMELKGKLPKRMLRAGIFADKHFDLETGEFGAVGEDPVTRDMVVKMMQNVQQKDDVAKRIQAGGGTDEASRGSRCFADLLERMLVLDPEKRITPAEALRHPFIQGDRPSQVAGNGRAGGAQQRH